MRAAHAVSSAIVLLSLLNALGSARSVHDLSSQGPDLGEGRQAIADLWTHTEGPPRGQAVSLELPDGDSEAVAQIVAAKKIDIAAAGLHHATVLEKQALEHKMRSDEEDETEITRAKIADTKVDRIRRELKSTEEKIKKLKSGQADLLVKAEEAKAAVTMASEKKKQAAAAKLKLLDAEKNSLHLKLENAQQKVQALAMDVVGAKEESKAAHEAQEETRLKNVALRVKLQAAQDTVSHAKFMDLKSRNLKKLAVAKFAKENSKKQNHHAKNDVKGAKEMLAIMASGPGVKEATASLDRAKKRFEDTKKQWIENTKNVDKTKNEINDNEIKWAKKVAYKAVMKTATLGAAAHAADKGVDTALTEMDRDSKKLAAQQAHKEFADAEKKAEYEKANLQHVAFAAKQDKAARAAAYKEQKKKMDEEAKQQEKQKAEADMAKSALAGAGKAPA